MKSRAQLEEIAKEIVNLWRLECSHSVMSLSETNLDLAHAIAKGLTRVQDEALNVMLPSYDEVIKDVEQMSDEINGPVHGASRAYYFIERNMKPPSLLKEPRESFNNENLIKGEEK